MFNRPNHNLRLIGALLALVAALVFLGAAAHGHHDACHDFCWLCQSSFGAVGLPATIVAFLIVWATSFIRVELTPDIIACDVTLHTSPRGPPAACFIASF
jgi:hypothetical protein